jgi:hypothetical protein
MTTEEVITKVIGLKNATAEITLQTVYSHEKKNLLKTNRETGELCGFVSIIKTSTSEAGLGWVYQALVNKQRAKEGLDKSFESQGLIDGQSFRTGSRTIIDTPKGPMVQLLFMPGSEPLSIQYRDGITGRGLTYKDIRGFLPKPSTPKNQGVESPVNVRSPYVDSVVDIQIKVIPTLIGYLKNLFGIV